MVEDGYKLPGITTSSIVVSSVRYTVARPLAQRLSSAGMYPDSPVAGYPSRPRDPRPQAIHTPEREPGSSTRETEVR
jgi:hypothetical protein